MRELENTFTNLLSNEREKIIETCDHRLSLFEKKMQLLVESKGTCNCIAPEVRDINCFQLVIIGTTMTIRA